MISAHAAVCGAPPVALAPYYSLRDYLQGRHAGRLYKVTLDAGQGCPTRDPLTGEGGCVYCRPSALAPAGGTVGAISAQIERGAAVIAKRSGAHGLIAYFQVGTSTNGPVDALRRAFMEALSDPRVRGLAISTRPDCVGEDVMGLLEALSERTDLWLELGLQSSNDATLARIGRGHTAEAFVDAVRRAHGRCIRVCAHLMLGLPGEGREEALESVRFVSALPVWGVKFHQTKVLPGTPLMSLFEEGRYTPPTLDEYVGLVVECLERLRPDVVVHRLVADFAPGKMAGAWGRNKFVVLKEIEDRMRAVGARQGARWRLDTEDIP